MAQFRKKPVVIEAVRWDGLNIHLIWDMDEKKTQPFTFDDKHALMIHTLEGVMRAEIGDWIIRGVAGEFYPCKPEIFEKSYEPCG